MRSAHCAHTWMSHWLEWCASTHFIHTVDRHAVASSRYLKLYNQRISVNFFPPLSFSLIHFMKWCHIICCRVWVCWVFDPLSLCILSCEWFETIQNKLSITGCVQPNRQWKHVYSIYGSICTIWIFQMNSIKQMDRPVIIKCTFPYVWFWPTFWNTFGKFLVTDSYWNNNWIMATISNVTNWTNIAHKMMCTNRNASASIESIVQQIRLKAFTRNVFEHSFNWKGMVDKFKHEPHVFDNKRQTVK